MKDLIRTGVIYHVSRETCPMMYIHVHWPLSYGKTLIAKHGWAPTCCRTGRRSLSALAEHAWETHHLEDWSSTTILDGHPHLHLINLLEAIHIVIRDKPNCLNRGWWNACITRTTAIATLQLVWQVLEPPALWPHSSVVLMTCIGHWSSCPVCLPLYQYCTKNSTWGICFGQETLAEVCTRASISSIFNFTNAASQAGFLS